MLKNDASSDLKRFLGRQNQTNELEFSSIYPLRKHWSGNSTNVSWSNSWTLSHCGKHSTVWSVAYFLLFIFSATCPPSLTLSFFVSINYPHRAHRAFGRIHSCPDLQDIMLNVFFIFIFNNFNLLSSFGRRRNQSNYPKNTWL